MDISWFLSKKLKFFERRLIYEINDTHMKKLVPYWIQYKNSLKYKVGCFWRFSYVYMSEKRVHQIDSKNEWLLLSVTFTAKLELVFVLTFENAFS